MKRRSAVLAGAATVAAGAGVIIAALRRSRPQTQDTAPDADVWALRFDTPQGTALALADFRGQPLLLNFWATWCAPCIEELPLLDRFAREQRERGWQVIGLAIDNPEPVRSFLAKLPLGFPIGLARSEGIDLARALGNTAGALPFTAVINRSGKVVARKLGVIAKHDLKAWIEAVN